MATGRLTDIFLPPDSEIVEAQIPSNTTLAAVLRGHQIREEIVTALVKAASAVFDPRKLRARQPYKLERTLDGLLRQFVYEIDADRFLRVAPRPGAPAQDLVAEILPIEKNRVQAMVRGAIDRQAPSLFAAMAVAGESDDLSIALADILAGEIDFNSDLQPGDTFTVSFEKVQRDGRPAGYGPIAAAEFNNDGRRLRAIRFAAPGGRLDYYDENGRSLRRFFLRSPLRFEPRVTSGFSRNRFHPILRTYRPHLGVDYHAPAGAPVIAVADGIVVSAGYTDGAGRQVRLRHASGYESSYLHLSSIAPAVRPGHRVSQGQQIGRVGATGLATAAHLDYRVSKNGVFVNPLREHRKFPPGEPVPAASRALFEEARDRALAELGRAPSGPAVIAAAGSR